MWCKIPTYFMFLGKDLQLYFFPLILSKESSLDFIDGKFPKLRDGIFSCVTCGVLCFACAAIIRPSKVAAHNLMSADSGKIEGKAVASEVPAGDANNVAFASEARITARPLKGFRMNNNAPQFLNSSRRSGGTVGGSDLASLIAKAACQALHSLIFACNTFQLGHEETDMSRTQFFSSAKLKGYIFHQIKRLS
ncbi:uncharacterized protein LOC141723758 [Apium graveolens]|uniref:uncharacterized protein LOC141723758 n=1 Tax=Apium graveolens TaxID=4045 RepID=UPI003D793290